MTDLWQLEPLTLLLVALTMVVSGLIHGAMGLGFPMVATPIIAIFLDVRLAILVTLLPTATVNLASLRGHRDYPALLQKFAPLVVFSLLGALLGARILALVDPDPFRLLLAALIVLFLWATYAGRLPRQWLQRWPLMAMIVFGLLAGLSGGTTNVMVAILIIYFLTLNIERATMVPAMNTCFLVGKVSQIVVFWLSGLIGGALLLQSVPFALLALASLLAGERLGAHVAAQSYRYALHAMLVLLAAVLVWQYLYR